jgi:hypothetical protein
MVTTEPRASTWRYLRRVGTLTSWQYVVFTIFAGWLAYLNITGGRIFFAHYFFLFLMPVAAGSGLLTVAKRGQLDLLFGAGRSRRGVWGIALLHCFLIPCLMAVVIFSMSGPNARAVLRVLCVLCFTVGVSFAIGLVELRYVSGVLWILARLLFVMTPAGLTASMHLSKGPDLPSVGTLALLTLIAPESVIEARMPAFFAAIAATLGIAALVCSFVLFGRADFGGKRS